jgi:Mrp family chromosome partitioning ATPase
MTRLQKKADSMSSGKHGDYSDTLVTIVDPNGPGSEAYRRMRTNLFYASVDDPPKVVVLTSSGPGEGKSTTAANLGVTLSEAGKSTLVVDCDLRKPMLHRYFETRNITGLVDILTMDRKPQDLWHEPMLNLKLITAGPPPLNPAELLSSQRFAKFLEHARQQFDYVLSGHASHEGRSGLSHRRGPRGRGSARCGRAGYAKKTLSVRPCANSRASEPGYSAPS